MKKNKLFKNLCNFCLMLGSLLICLVILEIVVDKITYIPKVENLDFRSNDANFILSDNRNLIYVPKPNAGKHNSYGHRGVEFPYKKGKKKRIIFIGDSVVEGLGVNAEDRFTEILPRLQNEKYEIINLGVRGYDFKQMFEYLKELGLKFNADYIFLGITYNDLILHSGEIGNLDNIFKQVNHSSFYTNYYKAKHSIKKLLLKTKIYRLIKYRNYSVEDNFEKRMFYRILPGDQKKILDDLVKVSDNFNLKIYFFFLPVNTNVEKNELKEFRQLVSRYGFKAFDLDKIASQTYKDKAGFFLENDPCHLNKLGNEAVAQIINKIMIDLW